MKDINIEKIKECPICQKWITYCLTEPSSDNPRMYGSWIRDKQKFWEDNTTYLTSMGFNYEAGLCKALDFIEITKHQKEDLEGCLLIVKVGNENKPATPQEIETTYKIIKDALDGVKGVRVVITQHNFTVEKIALPQLRRLQSEILTSFEADENTDPITNLEV
jgi:hypothetical protein